MSRVLRSDSQADVHQEERRERAARRDGAAGVRHGQQHVWPAGQLPTRPGAHAPTGSGYATATRDGHRKQFCFVEYRSIWSVMEAQSADYRKD